MIFRFAIAVLACYRLAQLITLDDGPFYFLKRIREWTDEQAAFEQDDGIKDGLYQSINDGFHCPYCVGIWLAVPLAAMVYTGKGKFWLMIFAIAGGQAFLEGRNK